MSSRREIGGSLPVENVQELASNKELNSVPDRYVRPELASDVVHVDDDSLKIPVIDLTRLNDDQHFGHHELAKLHHACEDWGFFQLINHGVREDLIEKMKDDTKEFFKLPLEKKRAYAQLPNSLEGYGQAFVVSEDQKLDWADMLFILPQPVNDRNMRFWPTHPPSFSLFEQIDERINVLDSMSGPDLIMSNGRYKSIEHRVVVNPKEERLSIAAFHGQRSDVDVGPIPVLVKENDPNYITVLLLMWLRTESIAPSQKALLVLPWPRVPNSAFSEGAIGVLVDIKGTGSSVERKKRTEEEGGQPRISIHVEAAEGGVAAEQQRRGAGRSAVGEQTGVAADQRRNGAAAGERGAAAAGHQSSQRRRRRRSGEGGGALLTPSPLLLLPLLTPVTPVTPGSSFLSPPSPLSPPAPLSSQPLPPESLVLFQCRPVHSRTTPRSLRVAGPPPAALRARRCSCADVETSPPLLPCVCGLRRCRAVRSLLLELRREPPSHCWLRPSHCRRTAASHSTKTAKPTDQTAQIAVRFGCGFGGSRFGGGLENHQDPQFGRCLLVFTTKPRFAHP
ncbi:hypothetical protein Syun_022511 [Stephania yunnanensis]|uniref:Uncharacterized protein n=1 Tax=Stephania yunnanensis TaxID=152371 RepID=A0AAP0I2W9_9MAGN